MPGFFVSIMQNDELQSIVYKNVADALAEDIGGGDLTASLIDADAVVGAKIIARQSLVLAGHPWAAEVFRQLDDGIQVDWYIEDGERAEADDVICKLVGPARALLSGERTALNFLQTLSATATTTAAWGEAVAGTGVRLLDTRKTLPGLRHAQKYAVRCGGGENHRSGLYDAILIKENHITAAGSIGQAIRQAREIDAQRTLEIEVETIAQLEEALDAVADVIMLDNFSPEQCKSISEQMNDQGVREHVVLEASGGITFKDLKSWHECGLDVVSTSAINRGVKPLDVSMLVNGL